MNGKALFLIAVLVLTVTVSVDIFGVYVVPEAAMDFYPGDYCTAHYMHVVRMYHSDMENALFTIASSFENPQNVRSTDPDGWSAWWVAPWQAGIQSWQWQLYLLFGGPDPLYSYTEFSSQANDPSGWLDGWLDGCHMFEITYPEYYVLPLTVLDTDWYDSSGSSGDHSDTEVYLLNVFDLVIGGPPYVQLNNDDDNENGIMDFTEDSAAIPEEDDLAAIYMWLLPFGCFGEVELKVVPQDSGSVYIWDEDDKTGQILPRDGLPYWERWWIQWGVPSEVKIEWIEGRDSAQQTCIAWSYIINDDDYVTNGTELYKPVILEVDMDIAGVKDYDYQWPGVTEEITPGALIPLGGRVQIERLKILPEDESLVPVNGSHPAVLYAKSGSSKIEVVDSQGLPIVPVFASRSQLDAAVADGLYVEGIATSDYMGDITLAFLWGNN